MKTFQKFCVTALTLTVASIAAAFPTTVRLSSNPEFRNEGQEVVIRTNKGTVTASTSADGDLVYHAFIQKGAVKGACYVFETETETDVQFNVRTDQSGTRSVKKVPCPSSKR